MEILSQVTADLKNIFNDFCCLVMITLVLKCYDPELSQKVEKETKLNLSPTAKSMT